MEDILKFKDRREREVFERLFKWWVSGGGQIQSLTITADETLTLIALTTQVDADTTAGDITITLPSAALNNGKVVSITKIVPENTLTVESPVDLINGETSYSWTEQWQNMVFTSKGDTWRMSYIPTLGGTNIVPFTF